MAFGDEQADAGAVAQRHNAERTKMMGETAYPAIRRVLAQAFGDINIEQNGQLGIPKSVQKQFGIAREGVNRDFDMAERGSQAYMTQSFKQSGNPYSETQLQDTLMQQGAMMEQGRSRAMGQLQFQEAQAGLGQYNTLMNLMGQGSQSALSIGQGFGAGANQALQFLPQTNRTGSALSGALAGAGTGAMFGPWGAVAGGVLGAAGGYFSSGG